MQTYRLEVKVSGWVTVEVEAESLEDAKERAEPPWSMQLGQLQSKSSEALAIAVIFKDFAIAGCGMSCEACTDPDGVPCFPIYGIGPHTHRADGATQPTPKDQWPTAYREDPDCPGHGVYWCPVCGDGKPEGAP